MKPTGEAVVMSIGKFIIDEHGMGTILLLETALHAIDLVFGNLEPRPSIPLKASGFAEAAEASYEATRRHGETITAIFGALDCDRQTVGEKKQAAGNGLVVGARHCV